MASGYIPPSAPITQERLCVSVDVPDDPQSRQAFAGALYALGQLWSWSGEAPLADREAAANYWFNEFYNVVAQLDARQPECGDSMSCEDVLDCLESNEGRRLVTKLSGSAAYGENVNIYDTYITQEIRDTPLAPAPADCDLDKLWAGIRYLVERIDDLGRDVLEDVVANQLLTKKIASLAEAIPVIGDIAAAVINQAVSLVPDLLALYNSHSSEANKDALACAIFEIACGECRYPTFDELLQAYSQWSVIDLLTNPTPQDVIQAIILAPTYPAETAYRSLHMVLLFSLGATQKAGSWTGIDLIELFCSLGEDLPSDNWETLCGGCGETWTNQQWDTNSVSGDAFTVPQGVVASDRVVGTQVPGFDVIEARARCTMRKVGTVERVRFEFSNYETFGGSASKYLVQLFKDGVEVFNGGYVEIPAPNTQAELGVFVGAIEADTVQVRVQSPGTAPGTLADIYWVRAWNGSYPS